jgi:hypothetical protein
VQLVYSPTFWKQAAERAIKTFAQVLAALLTADGTGLLDTNWPGSLSTAGMAAVLSVLTSMASAAVGPNDSPSLVAVGGRHAAR